jgi:hypothetical protein
LVLWNVEGSFERSSDEIEEAITKVWDELTFYEVQTAFHNWKTVENRGEHVIE